MRYCQRFSIGLTGGIASGKSTAATRFAQLGAAVVDTDVLAHALTSAQGEAMPAIRARFGEALLNLDGSLNRSAMRALVFENPAQRLVLESILHPMIHERTQALGQTAPGAYVVFVVPLLVESAKWRSQVDRIAVVDCDPATQQQRLMKRSELSAHQAASIMAAQASRTQRLAAADDILHNDGELEDLLAQVDTLHARYVSLAF
jgi:dephospho-CoA kinase